MLIGNEMNSKFWYLQCISIIEFTGNFTQSSTFIFSKCSKDLVSAGRNFQLTNFVQRERGDIKNLKKK